MATEDGINLLTLMDLNYEVLVREVISRTENCGILWSSTSSNSYQATVVSDSDTWLFILNKTQTSNNTVKYTFDVKKNSDSYVSLTDGPLAYDNRSSVVASLFAVVEIITLNLDTKLTQSLQIVQSLATCRD